MLLIKIMGWVMIVTLVLIFFYGATGGGDEP